MAIAGQFVHSASAHTFLYIEYGMNLAHVCIIMYVLCTHFYPSAKCVSKLIPKFPNVLAARIPNSIKNRE